MSHLLTFALWFATVLCWVRAFFLFVAIADEDRMIFLMVLQPLLYRWLLGALFSTGALITWLLA